MQHFLLVKQADFTASGDKLTAAAAANTLLHSGIWPVWKRTPCKMMVHAGDRIAVYLAGVGNQVVVATADVQDKLAWNASMRRDYLLSLSAVPEYALKLGNVFKLAMPVRIAEHLADLSFTRTAPTKKWGVCLMGGMRSITAADFQRLTTATKANHDESPEPIPKQRRA